ncbi:MAG TPA: cytochrome c peroxidase [Gemmatimonadaceae bacterium]
MRKLLRLWPGVIAFGATLAVSSVTAEILWGHRGLVAPVTGPVGRTFPPSAARLSFENDLDSLGARLDDLAASLREPSTARVALGRAREAFKRVEGLMRVYGPVLAKTLDGPVPETEDRPAGPLGAPAGFQIVEAAFTPGGESPGLDSLQATVRWMRDGLREFRSFMPRLGISDASALDAARLELARVEVIGLAGFDTDDGDAIAGEAAAALAGTRATLAGMKRLAGWATLDSCLTRAGAYLAAHNDSRSLDRLEFVVRYGNPIGHAIAALRAQLPKPPSLRRLWRQGAATLFDVGAFDAMALAPDFATLTSPELVALGQRLFHEPRLSGPGTRSCATCHLPQLAFTDGKQHSDLLTAPATPARNAPTLLNAALQLALFDDSRVGSLESQAEAVLANPAEMGSGAEVAAARLRSDSSYRHAFELAFTKHTPASDSVVTGQRLRVAVAAYVRSLIALNSRFDRAVRGDTAAITAPERRGFTLFMGKGRCGTCHFAPLFNGVMPPEFVESEPEIIGVPARRAIRHARLDADEGRGAVDHEPTHAGAFRVPTLRNVVLTAPYMHNGAYATLEQVVDFYNRGGGSGVGAKVTGQTLSAQPLGLTAREQRDLVAFLGTLTDTVLTPPNSPNR